MRCVYCLVFFFFIAKLINVCHRIGEDEVVKELKVKPQLAEVHKSRGRVVRLLQVLALKSEVHKMHLKITCSTKSIKLLYILSGHYKFITSGRKDN